MAIAPKKRFEILERDGFTCKYCGGKPPYVQLEIDHIIPKSKGGKDVVENLITSCSVCNIGKGSKILGEQEDNFWKKKVERKIYEYKTKFYNQWNLSRLGEVDKKTAALVAIYFDLMIRGEDGNNYCAYLSLPMCRKDGIMPKSNEEYRELEKQFMLGGEFCDEILDIIASEIDINELIDEAVNDSLWESPDNRDYSTRLNYIVTEKSLYNIGKVPAIKRFTLFPHLFDKYEQ